MSFLTKEAIDQVDRDYYDPRERAMGIQQILMPFFEEFQKENNGKPTHWDLLCWNIEGIAEVAKAYQDPNLLRIARELIMWLYSAHYTQPVELYGKPDRQKEGEEDNQDGV